MINVRKVEALIGKAIAKKNSSPNHPAPKKKPQGKKPASVISPKKVTHS
jgi:hypothetical protein